ncbi:hypothetical protein KUG47_06290 [Falsochrobactrum sp. TDYN1]|uniref:Uncharacterized protein n=1 Tax=Falsochrobactrum tianjinense TaxID=2706015 RepID=A0A949PM11_9HYPH|nr:hypothetical protein [Falsochrobactrum sp. TDYN1]MBV2143103.1 hypothetical protein [Falsochrobactrum sp. TDYN1]
MNALVQSYDDEIEQVLSYYKGDVRAAIEGLLKDRDFLVKEIEYASLAMSFGYSRGWKPSIIQGYAA